MRRSKREMHTDILEALAHHGPLKITYIMSTANVNYKRLKQYLSCLIQHNLVEEQTLHKKRVLYTITEKGQTILTYVRELDRALQITPRA